MPNSKKKDQSPGPKFVGFPVPTSNYFKVPNEAIDIIAQIDNIAELKIVLYVLRHTWGFQEYGIKKKITIDEFVHGRKRKDGSRIDEGTKLAEKSVRNGIERALDHGYLECEVDDRDKGRIKRYFRLKMRESALDMGVDYQVDQPDRYTLPPSQRNPSFEENYPDWQNLPPGSTQEENHNLQAGWYSLPPTRENIPSSFPDNTNRTGKEIRQERDTSNHESDESGFGASTYPHPLKFAGGKAPIPAFLRRYIEDFSRKFNNVEQVFSNLRQAANIFYDSGLDQDNFINCLYEAEEITLKAHVEKRNENNYPNRMPYFFACLRESVNELLAYQKENKA